VNLANVIQKLCSLSENPAAIKALATWPIFSITAYNMVTRLSNAGVRPRTVLDVGAHVGQVTVASAKVFPNVVVHAFEPQPYCVERLRNNTSKLEGISINPFALGDREGEATLRVTSDSQQSSLLPLAQVRRDAFQGARELETVKVEISTLDRVFADTELQPPVLLKVDAQGYEAEIIAGGVATLKRVDYVVLETSFEPTYEGQLPFVDVVGMMEECGFHFQRSVSWLAVPRTGHIFEIDVLFSRAA
jgi:FkbM family methyltransferase